MSNIILLVFFISFAFISIKSIFRPRKLVLSDLEKDMEKIESKSTYIGFITYIILIILSLVDIWGGLVVNTPYSIIGAAISIILGIIITSKFVNEVNIKQEKISKTPLLVRVYNAIFDSYILIMLLCRIFEK